MFMRFVFYDMDYVVNEILDGQPINKVILEYFDT